jgi:hypothetical protein
VTALAQQHPAVQIELTGPWPPYSFTGVTQPEGPGLSSGRELERPSAIRTERIALVDLLDRVLAGGVVVSGEVSLSVAEVDLVTVSLRALVTSISALTGPREDPQEPAR